MPATPMSAGPVRSLLAVCAALACLPAAQAQSAEPGKLQTVTVTAERRAENIRDVPNSVSALSGELLDVLNAGGQDIRQLAGRVPSLNIESSFGRAFPRFYIRGLGNTDFDLNASQPVSLVFDDVVQENPILKGFPIFDLERIEVLRGPQGTLFGRNSPAGVVKFESVKPGRRFEGYGALSLGSHSAVNAEGALNVPLAAGASMRVSLQSLNRNDWVDNTFDAGPTQQLEGYHDNAARVQLSLDPSKNVNALFNLHHRKLDGSARLFRANILAKGSNDLVPGFDENQVSYDGVNEQRLTNTGGSLRLRIDLGGMALNSITGFEKVEAFSRGDIDGGFGAAFLPSSGPGLIPFDAESADGLPHHRQVTQEFRLESTGSGPTRWLAGVYWFHEVLDIDSFNYSSIGGNVQNGYATQHQDNKAWAVFGSVNHRITPALEMRAGLRHTNDKKDFRADRLQAPPFSPSFIGRRTTSTDDSNNSFDVSALYALDQNVNLYARVATGFRAPSIQGRLLFGDTLSVADSETVRSYEAGVKADLLDRRARVAFNVFAYDIKDQQLTAVGGAANFNQLVNAKKGTGRGFELDAQMLASERLLLTVNGSYNKTRIRDKDLYIQPCGGGCTVLDPAGPVPGTVSIDGNPLPQSPEWVWNLGARYGFALAGGDAYVMADLSYRSKINFFLYESVEFTGRPLTEIGLRAGYQWANGKYEAAAFVRNAANQIRVVGGIDFNNLTGFINEPRTLGVQLRATF